MTLALVLIAARCVAIPPRETLLTTVEPNSFAGRLTLDIADDCFALFAARFTDDTQAFCLGAETPFGGFGPLLYNGALAEIRSPDSHGATSECWREESSVDVDRSLVPTARRGCFVAPAETFDLAFVCDDRPLLFAAWRPIAGWRGLTGEVVVTIADERLPDLRVPELFGNESDVPTYDSWFADRYPDSMTYFVVRGFSESLPLRAGGALLVSFPSNELSGVAFRATFETKFAGLRIAAAGGGATPDYRAPDGKPAGSAAWWSGAVSYKGGPLEISLHADSHHPWRGLAYPRVGYPLAGVAPAKLTADARVALRPGIAGIPIRVIAFAAEGEASLDSVADEEPSGSVRVEATLAPHPSIAIEPTFVLFCDAAPLVTASVCAELEIPRSPVATSLELRLSGSWRIERDAVPEPAARLSVRIVRDATGRE